MTLIVKMIHNSPGNATKAIRVKKDGSPDIVIFDGDSVDFTLYYGVTLSVEEMDIGVIHTDGGPPPVDPI